MRVKDVSRFRESARLSVANGTMAFFGNRSMEFMLNSLSISKRDPLRDLQNLDEQI